MKMVFQIANIFFGSLLLIGCATSDGVQSSDQGFKKIETKEQYMAQVVGRTVLHKASKAAVMTHADGTMTGTSNGLKITGTWTWEDGLFCREVMLGAKQVDRDCQLMEISSDQLRVVTEEGNGSATVFDLG